MTKGIAIGIDLGTSNSCVGVWKNNYVEIIENNLSKRSTPSWVYLNFPDMFIGDEALQKSKVNPKNSIYNIKRLIGRHYKDEQLQYIKNYFPFDIIDHYSRPLIKIQSKNKYYKKFSTEEISSMILSKMKETAENYLGQSVTDAVISVPAYFNDTQRRATLNAGRIAGLNVLQIINEPTATALTYGLNNQNKMKENENILIIDLGGGTYDVSLVNINNNNYKVLATAGDTNLGGEDFTNRLMYYFIEEIKNKYKMDDSFINPKTLIRLRTVCEKAKCVLSSVTEAPIEIEYLSEDIDFSSSITRSKFEEICSDLFEKIIPPMETVLTDSKLPKSGIDEIILVGGSTRIPKIQEIISSYFDEKVINKTVNKDESVACGATILASILSNNTSEYTKNINIYDIIPYSILYCEEGEKYMKPLFERNSNIPFENFIPSSSISKDYIYIYEYNLYQNNYNLLLRIEKKFPHKKNNYISRYFRNENNNIIRFIIDNNGIFSSKAYNNGQIYCNWDDCRGNLLLDRNGIKQSIEKNENFKKFSKKEKERIEAMNDFEDYAYRLRAPLKDKNELNIKFMKYVKTLNDEINSHIEWVKNNKDANKEEYEKRKQYLDEKYKVFYDLFDLKV